MDADAGALGGGCGVPLKQIVSILTSVASDATGVVCEVAIHALASVAHAATAGPLSASEFRPLATPCLGVASSVCLSEPPPNTHTAAAIARLSTSIVCGSSRSNTARVGRGTRAQAPYVLRRAALASEVGSQGGSPAGGPTKGARQLAKNVERCGVVNAAACALSPTPPLRAEALHFACASYRVSPQLLAHHARHSLHDEGILSGLKSHYSPLRRAAIAAQRALGEATAGGDGAEGDVAASRARRERIVVALFDLLEYEPAEEVLEEAKMLLLSQLHATAENDPAFWLRALRAVILELQTKKGVGDQHLGGRGGGESMHEDDEVPQHTPISPRPLHKQYTLSGPNRSVWSRRTGRATKPAASALQGCRPATRPRTRRQRGARRRSSRWKRRRRASGRTFLRAGRCACCVIWCGVGGRCLLEQP